jgi:hypothetical protein
MDNEPQEDQDVQVSGEDLLGATEAIRKAGFGLIGKGTSMQQFKQGLVAYGSMTLVADEFRKELRKVMDEDEINTFITQCRDWHESNVIWGNDQQTTDDQPEDDT